MLRYDKINRHNKLKAVDDSYVLNMDFSLEEMQEIAEHGYAPQDTFRAVERKPEPLTYADILARSRTVNLAEHYRIKRSQGLV